MKTVYSFIGILFIFVFLGCETFPDNPPLNAEPLGIVSIEHVGTEYVPATHPVVGVNADKTNVLFFNICITDIEVHSIEFLGRAMVESETGFKEHAFHFKTDEVVVNPQETGYTFNTLDSILPSTQYTVVRSKFPTNDYAPFKGDIGKIQKILITDVRVYDKTGNPIEVETK